MDVDNASGDNAQHGGEDKGAGGQPGQAGGQVDEEKGEHRHQAEEQEVVEPALLQFAVDGFEPAAEAPQDRLAQQVAADEKGQGGADGGGDVGVEGAAEGAEQGARGQRQHRRAGQAERGLDDVHGHEAGHGEQGMLPGQGDQGLVVGLQGSQGEEPVQVEREKKDNGQRAGGHECESAPVHGVRPGFRFTKGILSRDQSPSSAGSRHSRRPMVMPRWPSLGWAR